MHSRYHRAITEQALRGKFGETALAEVIAANLRQDRIRGQLGHPEFHFDSDALEAGLAYMETCRGEIAAGLQRGDPPAAWHAFGRLTHAAQDLYAHSNYVTLWLERFPGSAWPDPQEIDPLDADLFGEKFRSGKVYLPMEPLSWIPWLRRFVMPLLPRDAHGWMNLDVPERGPKFAYACAAAIKRTAWELERTLLLLSPELRIVFFEERKG